MNTSHNKIPDLSEPTSKTTKCFRLEIINNLLFVQLQCATKLGARVISKSYCYIAGNDRKCIINGGPDQAAGLQPAAIQITRKFKQASFHFSVCI